MLNIEDIKNIIPHRFPFLLVDRIVSVSEDGNSCVGIKNVTANENVVYGRDPEKLIFPHPLIVEHMAQVGCCILMQKPEAAGRLAYFAAIDDVTFKRDVVPGDTITTTVTLLGGRRGIWKIRGISKVGDEVIFEGVLTCAFVDK